MKKCLNRVTVEGYLYQHTLALKTVQDKNSDNFGKEFINGTIEVATDEEGLNIIPVRYTYVTATTKTGATNKTYTVLKSIIDGANTWLQNGKDLALKVKCDTSFALNDFYAKDGSPVSQMVQEGGFISTVNTLSAPEDRNKFEIDLFITNFSRVEADEEKGTPEFGKIRAAGFNFRNDILPMNFILKNPKGLDYIEGLDISGSNPVFTKCWGKINHTTTKVNKVEESAFGEAVVTSYDRKVKEWVITNMSPTFYDFGDENILTANDIQTALQNREVLLAEVKQRSDAYKASTAAAPVVTPSASTTAFNF